MLIRIVWQFASFHHPVYSSDENDYGDLWKGKSTWGDTRIRELTKLFDRYKVDVIWNGRIHSYERTWPLVKESHRRKVAPRTWSLAVAVVDSSRQGQFDLGFKTMFAATSLRFRCHQWSAARAEVV